MKKTCLFLAFIFCSFTLTAQEQPGIVKTIGRPGHAGEPLGQVLIRVLIETSCRI